MTFTPADTRTMGIIHAALRRDLDRAALVLADPALDEARLLAVAAHLEWVMDFLHEHHSGEDTDLYPLVVARGGPGADLARAMDADHHAIIPGMDAVRAAAAGARGAGPVGERARGLLDAVADLRGPLDGHLEREEREMMPLVSAVVSHEEWDAYEANRRSPSAKELAFVGHWIVDGLAPEHARLITGTVPAVVRFVLLNFLGGPYRRTARACWAGTGAEGVRATPLATA